jgi:carboxyvinyl-carboxyphosphonate phosphorylmutase
LKSATSPSALRAALNGERCISPASVYDALSARVAEAAGATVGMLAGSVASAVAIGAPDIVVLTATELATEVRRITRASNLSLMVDADHGFGNALNVMRTVEELEHAGAAGLSIEDTDLPQPFGTTGATYIGIAEMQGKLRASVAARRNPDLVIAGRSGAIKGESLQAVCERVKAYTDTGVDAIFLVGPAKLEELDALRKATTLPFILGQSPESWAAPEGRKELAHRGVRLLLTGHQPLAAALKALRDTYAHLQAGGSVAELKGKIVTGAEQEALLRGEEFKGWQEKHLARV